MWEVAQRLPTAGATGSPRTEDKAGVPMERGGGQGHRGLEAITGWKLSRAGGRAAPGDARRQKGKERYSVSTSLPTSALETPPESSIH